MTRRSERIGEQLRAEVARLLRDETTDPRIGLVSVTRVDVAPDLSNAKVYWRPLDAKPDHSAEEIDAIASGLDSAAGFLRTRLARVLALRRIPQLAFRYDPSIAGGAEMLDLLRRVNVEGDGT